MKTPFFAIFALPLRPSRLKAFAFKPAHDCDKSYNRKVRKEQPLSTQRTATRRRARSHTAFRFSRIALKLRMALAIKLKAL